MLRHEIGIIGYGGFGPFLHRAWSTLDHATVGAVADVDPARDPGGVRFYTRWEDLVADPQVSVVAVVTPPSTHADIACAAMEAGKHVLIDKPVATRLEDTGRLLAVRERTGQRATVNFMLRYNPVVVALQGWCREPFPFGRLRRVLVENYAQDESLAPDHWFWDPARSGGILVEHAVHFIDIVNGCTRAHPIRIDGLAVHRNERQEDRVMATVVYSDGLVATHYHAFSRPGFFEHTSMRFVFDLAEVDVDGWIPLSGRITALASGATEGRLADLPGFAATRREAVGAVRDASQPEGGGASPGLHRVHSGGVGYDVEVLVEGAFADPLPKPEAYQHALHALMADLVRQIDAPGHPLRVTLEDGIASLQVALQATARARQG